MCVYLLEFFFTVKKIQRVTDIYVTPMDSSAPAAGKKLVILLIK